MRLAYLVGGPKHGEVITVRPGDHIQVPIMDRMPVARWAPPEDYPMQSYRTGTYRCERYGFGATRQYIEFWVWNGNSTQTAECFIADLLVNLFAKHLRDGAPPL